MPYAPGIVYRGDQWLAQGISNLGQAAAAGVDRVRNDARETQALRKLAEIYDPQGKDKYTAMGLGELRGAAQGFALEQNLGDQRIRQTEALARIGNLQADNLRSDEFLRIQQEQMQRTQALDELRKKAQLLMSQPVPRNPILDNPDVNAAFPGIREQYSGPMAQIERAMREAPGGVPPEVVQAFVRYSAEMSDPTRLMRAKAAAQNAQAALANATRPKGEMTAAQQATAARGERSLNLREAAGLRQQLKDLDDPSNLIPEDAREEQRVQIYRRLGQLAGLAGGAEGAGGQETPEPPAAPSSGVPTITSREQFDQLPRGAVYVDRNGKKFRKP